MATDWDPDDPMPTIDCPECRGEGCLRFTRQGLELEEVCGRCSGTGIELDDGSNAPETLASAVKEWQVEPVAPAKPRNLELALQQVQAMIRRQLGPMAVDKPAFNPLTGFADLAVLSPANVRNLAAQIVGSLDEFGRED